jgi:RNA polymerase sigma-70 factor (ECF subfamily)
MKLPSIRPAAAPPRELPALPRSDAEVVGGLVRGERWAAEALYERAAPAAERTLRCVLRDAAGDYEDLLQTTLERVVRTLVEARFAEACSLASWASSIATRVAIDALRTRIRERRIYQEWRLSETEVRDDPTLERRLIARSRLELLQRTLATMKPDQAHAVFLHDVLGHSLSEIALMAGISETAAQSRLVRGRSELLRRARSKEDR